MLPVLWYLDNYIVSLDNRNVLRRVTHYYVIRNSASSTEKTFLRDFLAYLKHSLQN